MPFGSSRVQGLKVNTIIPPLFNVKVCACEYRCLQRPGEGVRSAKAEVVSSYEPPSMGSGN